LKQDIPDIEKLEIKSGFDERNNFLYRNFFIFDVYFEGKFREASRFEIQ
jgi:hypothetical protein